MNTSLWLENLVGHPVPLLLRQSVESGLLALIVCALTMALRDRLSAVWRHRLWLVVFLRLLLPALPVLPVAVPPAPVFEVPEVANTHEQPIVSMPVDVVKSSPRQTAEVPNPIVKVEPAAHVNWWSVAVAVWLFTATAIAVATVFRSVALHRRLRRSMRNAEPSVIALFTEVGRSQGLSRVPPLLICSAVNVPAIAGWFYPQVLLPEGFAERVPEDRLKLVLAHELAHWKRKDIWWQMVVSALLAVHWFNPLLWLARYRLKEEAEAACDEWLLARIGNDEARSYGETLLDVSRWSSINERTWLAGAQGLLGMAESTSGVRRRVLRVTHWILGRRASPWCGATALILIAVCGFLRAAEPKLPAPSSGEWRDKVMVRLVDDKTKKPLENVLVVVTSDQNYVSQSRSDSKGTAIAQLPKKRPTIVRVLVQPDDRAHAMIRWSFYEAAFVAPESIAVSLKHGTPIGGRIIDDTGKPVEGAKLTLHLWNSQTVSVSQQVSGDVQDYTVTTDKSGHWRFNNAPPMPKYFSVAVDHPTIIHSLFSLPESEVALCYSNKFEIMAHRGKRVEVRVVDSDDHPIKAKLIWGIANNYRIANSTYETDANGLCTILNAPSGKSEVITAIAPNFAPSAQSINTESRKEPVVIRMSPGKTLRVRVVDSKGSPLGGVKATVREMYSEAALFQRAPIPDRSFTTDKEGRFHWDHAPADRTCWDFTGVGSFRPTRDVKLNMEAEEVTVSMLPKAVVEGTVKDAESGEPIPEFRVTPGELSKRNSTSKPEHSSYIWWPQGGTICLDGKLMIPVDWQSVSTPGWPEHYVLRVSAPGYMPVISEPLGEMKESKTWNVVMKKAAPTIVKVLQPDGKPAVGATLVPNNVGSGHLTVSNGRLSHLLWPEGENSLHLSDGSGIASMPPEDPSYKIVAVHDSGWGVVSSEEPQILQLEPWSALEIDLKGFPAPIRQSLSLIDHSMTDKLLWSLTPSIGRNGSATVYLQDHLVPATYTLSPMIGKLPGFALPVRLKAGEKRKLKASELWHFVKLRAELEIPEGINIDEERNVSCLIRGSKLDTPSDPKNPFTSMISAKLTFTQSGDGKSFVQSEPVGLLGGEYQMSGLFLGLKSDPNAVKKPTMASYEAQTFTIKASTGGTEFKESGDWTESVPWVDLPKLELRNVRRLKK